MFDTYRVAVVTGATSGIGKATVLELRRRGLTVYAVGRSEAPLQELAATDGVIPIKADVRDTDTIVRALAGIEVDILVNNAGILSTRALFHEIDPAEIDAMIDVNLKAPMHLTRALLPGMVERKRGHLLYVGSSGGQAPYPNMGAYGPSKAGLSLFCDNLRCDLLGSSVRVTEVVPGRVQTDLYRTAMAGNQARALLYDGYRPIQPENIASIVINAIELPVFVDVARIEVFPTDQATGGGTMVKFQDEANEPRA
ncbi:short-chain dehydrogenase/reductase SDR family protein (plasmid) [Rhizobium sp. CIAT894]|uniref:SDR family oxidoreductase n=1 Tax=Rhizobium sp. CIAT894 TaxID=2020312 RepID=UPI000A1FD356|nr:SDR family oxidoreductase [Rhizobium sp. CIAT894]ARM92111.1 short-chain dehydrogenase/reductase SDR family protein [Rhizobium sp. CIAT894]